MKHPLSSLLKHPLSSLTSSSIFKTQISGGRETQPARAQKGEAGAFRASALRAKARLPSLRPAPCLPYSALSARANTRVCSCEEDSLLLKREREKHSCAASEEHAHRKSCPIALACLPGIAAGLCGGCPSHRATTCGLCRPSFLATAAHGARVYAHAREGTATRVHGVTARSWPVTAHLTHAGTHRQGPARR